MLRFAGVFRASIVGGAVGKALPNAKPIVSIPRGRWDTRRSESSLEDER
jgi:hypothetical protein